MTGPQGDISSADPRCTAAATIPNPALANEPRQVVNGVT